MFDVIKIVLELEALVLKSCKNNIEAIHLVTVLMTHISQQVKMQSYMVPIC